MSAQDENAPSARGGASSSSIADTTPANESDLRPSLPTKALRNEVRQGRAGRSARREGAYPQKVRKARKPPASHQLIETAIKTAVIYCRVSSTKQKNCGDGLHSQEHRCRDYAASRGYTVAPNAVFHDDVSGGGDFMKRPGMVAMLAYLDRQPHGTTVIFDDLKRFARDTIFHLKLRQQLALTALPSSASTSNLKIRPKVSSSRQS